MLDSELKELKEQSEKVQNTDSKLLTNPVLVALIQAKAIEELTQSIKEHTLQTKTNSILISEALNEIAKEK